MKRSRVALGLGLVFALAVLYWLLDEAALIEGLLDPASLESRVGMFGLWGPLVLIGLMAIPLLAKFTRERVRRGPSN